MNSAMGLNLATEKEEEVTSEIDDEMSGEMLSHL
jgi:hypothetical protein